MRSKISLLAVLLALTANAQAALKDQSVKYRLAINQDGRMIHETKRQAYSFRVEIVNDSQGVKTEWTRNGRPFVEAVKGERYSVRLYNPLPVRVAVNLTVDGLNSISGKPSGITDGQKWMIEAYSSVTIPGWQVSDGETRRFFFTDKPKSYAKWRGDVTGKDLSANCGVIGAAYFWNQAELDRYYEDHPIYRTTQRYQQILEDRAKSSLSSQNRDFAAGASSAPACEPRMLDKKMRAEEKEVDEVAGTGMGERESHPTYQVEFDYNRGMYSVSDAVVIYYDFKKAPSPNPFPAADYAPEMD